MKAVLRVVVSASRLEAVVVLGLGLRVRGTLKGMLKPFGRIRKYSGRIVGTEQLQAVLKLRASERGCKVLEMLKSAGASGSEVSFGEAPKRADPHITLPGVCRLAESLHQATH